MMRRAAFLCNRPKDVIPAQQEVLNRLADNGAHELTIQYAKLAMKMQPTGGHICKQAAQWFVSSYHPALSKTVLGAANAMSVHGSKLREAFGCDMVLKCSFRVPRFNLMHLARQSLKITDGRTDGVSGGLK